MQLPLYFDVREAVNSELKVILVVGFIVKKQHQKNDLINVTASSLKDTDMS